MAHPGVCRQYGEELERRLRLKTFSLALKLLEREQDVPANATRPLEDLGHHLSLCQAFQLARRDGVAMAMLKEDHWCCEPVIGYGLGEPPEYFLEGNNCVYGVIPALTTGQNQVAVPCGGGRYRAMAADDELIFTAPVAKLEPLILGLRSIEKAGRKLPIGHSFLPEYPLPEPYQRIAAAMGYVRDPGDAPGDGPGPERGDPSS